MNIKIANQIKLGAFLFIFYQVLSLNAQQTDAYKKFTDQLKTYETKKFVKKYKNGKIKEIYSLTYYEYEGVKYSFYSGEYIRYYRNGNKSFERQQDMFGTPLIINWYYPNGDLSETSKTIKLDTKAESLYEFLSSDKSILITSLSEKYLPLNGSKGKPTLRKKGNYLNNKKIGVWEIYKNGKVIKTKSY
ncbi:MAG: hypothetical protein KDC74_03160 [Flavobacteriaceae bacterium]|nr:hypothetical protein [Flavobacteriaceae bacterium]